jgi:tripartite-type tricarboxylate transporter receptor subunit TctC
MHALLSRIVTSLSFGLSLGAALASPLAMAQDYPNKPVKVVVPYPPGSGLDRVARLTAERLSLALAQPFIVENKAGAGGNIGAEFAFRSAPDGYTLLVTPPSPLVINQVLYPKLGYAPEEFVPVSVIASLPNVLVVSNSLPVNSLAQLLAYAKANPAPHPRRQAQGAGRGQPGAQCLAA